MPRNKTKKSGYEVLQLVKLELEGGLSSDNQKTDWRKRYAKRKKTIEEIENYAIEIF